MMQGQPNIKTKKEKERNNEIRKKIERNKKERN
jgi:hypothetical protein